MQAPPANTPLSFRYSVHTLEGCLSLCVCVSGCFGKSMFKSFLLTGSLDLLSMHIPTGNHRTSSAKQQLCCLILITTRTSIRVIKTINSSFRVSSYHINAHIIVVSLPPKYSLKQKKETPSMFRFQDNWKEKQLCKTRKIRLVRLMVSDLTILYCRKITQAESKTFIAHNLKPSEMHICLFAWDVWGCLPFALPTHILHFLFSRASS